MGIISFIKKKYLQWKYRHIGHMGANARLDEGIKFAHIVNVSIGSNSSIGRFCTILASPKPNSIKIGDNTRIHDFCILKAYDGYIHIGNYCSLHSFSYIAGHGGVQIGNYVRIASGVKIYASNHNYKNRDIPIYKQGVSAIGITIEDDVWIGTNAVILDGVKIGKGSIVAAGAVVTKNVPPYSIVAGIPARVIKKR